MARSYGLGRQALPIGSYAGTAVRVNDRRMASMSDDSASASMMFKGASLFGFGTREEISVVTLRTVHGSVGSRPKSPLVPCPVDR